MTQKKEYFHEGKRTTRPIRWHEINRAMLIMGYIGDYSKGECWKSASRLKEQIATGRVVKDGRGVYRAILPDANVEDDSGDDAP